MGQQLRRALAAACAKTGSPPEGPNANSCVATNTCSTAPVPGLQGSDWRLVETQLLSASRMEVRGVVVGELLGRPYVGGSLHCSCMP